VSTLTQLGVTVAPPEGWEVEFRPAEEGRVILHLSNYPLPPLRSDFGGHALEGMGPGKVFLALLEGDSQDADRGLYRASGPPRLAPADFSPDNVHRPVPGQTGAQRFFTVEGRAFCCYAVIGALTHLPESVAEVNRGLAAVSFAPTPTSEAPLSHPAWRGPDRWPGRR